MENKTLMTDFYELTMAQTYFNEGKQEEKAVFDAFFRKNPFEGGYTVSSGLDNIIEYIENFHFDEDDINYLRSLGSFNEKFLNYLKDLRFTGDLFAIPDGTPVFPNEPVITVKANVIESQIIETALLTNFNHGSLVATAARRITNEAKNCPVMEFGARRARGEDSAVEASKYAYINGCAGTSNTLAGKKYRIPVLGTMAHSLVTAEEDEYTAFLKYAKSNPNNCVFLVDTYDTLRSGIPNAIKVAKDYLVPNNLPFKGIRIDSGDLAYLSKEARKMLDESGFPDTGICLSNGLNELTIRDLLRQEAEVNSFGVGDNIAASKERLGGVYKLVAIGQEEIKPRIKISDDRVKTTNPGYKKVYRFYDKETGFALGDVVTLAEEEISEKEYTLIHPVEQWKTKTLTNYKVRPLQVPIFSQGKLVYSLPSIEERKKYSEEEFQTLYPEVQRITNPHEYYVDLSRELLDLKQQLIEAHQKSDKESSVKKLVKKCEKKN